MLSRRKHILTAIHASAIVGIAMLFQVLPLSADDPTDAWDKLTGVSTAQSDALGKRATDLATEYVQLQARRKVSTDRNEQIEIYQRSPELLKQAQQAALDEAKARAHAAVEQRCLQTGPATSAAADPIASPFLCAAVRGGATSAAGPWDVCACARQYLDGLNKEIKDVQTRAQQFVGQQDFAGVITAQRVSTEFPSDSPFFTGPAAYDPAIEFEREALQIQDELVIRTLHTEEGFPPGKAGFTPAFWDDIAHMRRAQAEALRNVQGGVGLLWKLHQSEARFGLGILEQTVEQRQKLLRGDFQSANEAAGTNLVGNQDWDTRWAAYEAQIAPFCDRANSVENPFVGQTVQRVRAIVNQLKDVRQRLVDDMNDWKNFTLNATPGAIVIPGSSTTPGVDSGEDFAKFIQDTFASTTLTFTIPTSTGGLQSLHADEKEWRGPANCRAFAYYLNPIERDAGRAVAGIATAVQARYPEAKYGCCEVGTGISTISLTYKTDESKQIAEGAAPGAASSESP